MKPDRVSSAMTVLRPRLRRCVAPSAEWWSLALLSAVVFSTHDGGTASRLHPQGFIYDSKSTQEPAK